ncbi:chorismate synthase [Candidatus Woesearchaeota archaeon]|nr:chorismate synthase [Candidatus Woesearchaeota archaeon]
MPGNSFGSCFQVTNWGESHGKAIGVIIDGCPPLIELSEAYIQKALDQRAPGQSTITTQRKEPDTVEILSGVYEGKTTGTPIALMIKNVDDQKQDYQGIKALFRPSHADYTYTTKYGIRDPFGGGRSSARLTAGNVAAGAVALLVLQHEINKGEEREKGKKEKTLSKNLEIIAYVKSVKDVTAHIDPNKVMKEDVDQNRVRCPDKKAAAKMIACITKAAKDGDSVGGIIECVIRNVPSGLGEPIFDKLEADLAKAMLSINATKGFQVGSGFQGTTMYASEHNDTFTLQQGTIQTKTNYSGGIQGGISNGMPIIFQVAFKPPASIRKEQQSVTTKGKSTTIAITGRHDPCVVPRAVPIVEAMASIVLCDHYLRNRAQCGECRREYHE